jgi:transcription antitermination protein NusB
VTTSAGSPDLTTRTVTEPAPRPRSHSTRSKARKRALDILFEAELRGDDPLETLAVRTERAEPPVREYTAALVQGVVRHRTEIDRRIAASMSKGWTVERMPRVDRTAARIAVYEIDFGDVPDAVAVSEAVALVTELSTDESPAYLNGLLGAVLATKTPDAEPPAQSA